MITAHELSKNYGGQTLFEEVDLQLNAGNCFGIVGANGSGKSTLLRILAEQETSSGGQVIRVKSARVGMLEQDHFAYEDTPIIRSGHAGK
jgi:ATPase subunit of ABC transporter with duplicated ATPase domains